MATQAEINLMMLEAQNLFEEAYQEFLNELAGDLLAKPQEVLPSNLANAQLDRQQVGQEVTNAQPSSPQ